MPLFLYVCKLSIYGHYSPSKLTFTARIGQINRKKSTEKTWNTNMKLLWKVLKMLIKDSIIRDSLTHMGVKESGDWILTVMRVEDSPTYTQALIRAANGQQESHSWMSRGENRLRCAHTHADTHTHALTHTLTHLRHLHTGWNKLYNEK